MGVPAFFRWLTKKYPSVICDCVEEKARQLPNGRAIPIDASQPNPNNVEFDNLYLDMNGIIHPCTHPEDRPAPKNEDEMMVAIFEFIDRIFGIVRPRKVLYMAIDGVAPRAKMNQQRSRRFRASKETGEKIEMMASIKADLTLRGCQVPAEKAKGEHFDSNCITPGTPFMHRLSACLHYYVHDRLRNDAGWKDIIVILSDANVPGEGEHKIMDYIRRQRAQPNHDTNTKHVLCGADADLIMLGLATHEPHFTIIREEFKPNQPRPCDICGQLGHEMKDCQGLEKEKSGEHDEIGPSIASAQNFIFVRLYVLREYLARELAMPSLPFPYDLERAIDDWVFMCFFVGNDFLPHLPSLEIREGAIDRLVTLYKKTVMKTKGWVTDSGFVTPERVGIILSELGLAEDEIFKKRQRDEIDFRQRMKNKNRRGGGSFRGGRPSFQMGGQYAPRAVGRGEYNPGIQNPRQEAYQGRMQAMRFQAASSDSNADAAVALRAMLQSSTEEVAEEKAAVEAKNAAPAPNQQDKDSRGSKRKPENNDDDDDFSHDEVRLWEDGFKERYYESKFAVAPTDEAFRSKVACEYVRGLCWVLQYYYQGVPSWKWYFPYHYAPFASDFLDLSTVETLFEKGTKPFSPLEQLMGVFPAASRAHVPEPWGVLMTDPESPIIDFYPEDFKIDLNGKKYAWQGVALLPFVDENRLKQALLPLHNSLTADEKRRNILGEDLIYVGKHHKGYDFVRGLLEGTDEESTITFVLDHTYFHGITGNVLPSPICVEVGGSISSPVQGLDDIFDCHVACLGYRDPRPEEGFKYPAIRLPGAKAPQAELKPHEYDERRSGPYRPQIGMAPSNQRGSLHGAGHRMLGHHTQRPSMNSGYSRGGGPRPQGANSSASSYFNSYDQRQMSRGGGGPGRGGRGGGGAGGGGGGGGNGGGDGRSNWNRSDSGRDGYERRGNSNYPQHGGNQGNQGQYQQNRYDDGYQQQQNRFDGYQPHPYRYGGYEQQQNRYPNSGGPPATSNIRAQDSSYYSSGNSNPRYPGPQRGRGGGGGGSGGGGPPQNSSSSAGYGYYTSDYQGKRF